MKPTFFIIIFSIALCSFNCKGSKDTASKNNKVKTENVSSNSNPANSQNQKVFRFTVSFISKGAGTDYQIKQKYDAFISEFEAKNKIKLPLNKASWGREGEVDYCFEMNGISKDITEKFIAESKSLLSASDRINLGENTNCRGVIK